MLRAPMPSTTHSITSGRTLKTAWKLVFRHPRLVVWELLHLLFSSGLIVGLAVLAFMGVGLFIAQHEWDSLLAILDAALDAVAIARSPTFWVGLAGVVFFTMMLGMAGTAWFAGGLYGHLAALIRGETNGRTRWGLLWRQSTRHFPAMIGVMGMTLVLGAIWALLTSMMVVWPMALAVLGVLETGEAETIWVVLSAVGMAVSAVLALLFYLWRMLALGPIVFEECGVPEAFGRGLRQLSQYFLSMQKLVFSALFVISPAVLIYIVFGVLAWLLGTRPDLEGVASVAEMVLDLGLTLTWAASMVFMGAAFLLDHAQRFDMVVTPPPTSPDEAALERSRMAMELLLGAGEEALGLTLPKTYPNRIAISELFTFPEPEPAPVEAEALIEADDVPVNESPELDLDDFMNALDSITDGTGLDEGEDEMAGWFSSEDGDLDAGWLSGDDEEDDEIFSSDPEDDDRDA